MFCMWKRSCSVGKLYISKSTIFMTIDSKHGDALCCKGPWASLYTLVIIVVMLHDDRVLDSHFLSVLRTLFGVWDCLSSKREDML